MFINRSLRRQLFAGFAAVTAVLLVALAVGWLSIGAVDRRSPAPSAKPAELAAQAGDVRDMATSQGKVVISADQIADHRNDVAIFRRTLATLGRYSTTPDARADVRRTQALFVRWAAIDDRIIDDSRLGVTRPGRADHEDAGGSRDGPLTKAVTQLSTAISRADTTAADRAPPTRAI